MLKETELKQQTFCHIFIIGDILIGVGGGRPGPLSGYAYDRTILSGCKQIAALDVLSYVFCSQK